MVRHCLGKSKEMKANKSNSFFPTTWAPFSMWHMETSLLLHPYIFNCLPSYTDFNVQIYLFFSTVGNPIMSHNYFIPRALPTLTVLPTEQHKDFSHQGSILLIRLLKIWPPLLTASSPLSLFFFLPESPPIGSLSVLPIEGCSMQHP